MPKNWSLMLVFVLGCSLSAGACNPDEGDDPIIDDPDVHTSAYFAPDVDNPERSLLPLPSLLAINQETDPPSLSIKASTCFEPGSAVEASLTDLEALDGFGTYTLGAIQAYFGAELDPASLAGNVILFDMGAAGGDGSDADLENPIRVAVQLSTTAKYIQGCAAAPVQVPTAIILPVDDAGLPVPLKGGHLYGLGLLQGILDADGDQVQPFYIWNLVRAAEEIVPDMRTGDAFLSSMALITLQELHRPILDGLSAMGHPRDEVILAWAFVTQTTDGALASINARLGEFGPAQDSTAVTVPAAGLPIPPLPAEVFLTQMGLSCAAIGAGPDCPGLGTMLSGQFVSPKFQQKQDLALPFMPVDGGATQVPGRFDHPQRPMPQGANGNTISFLATTPAGATGPYPVIIFQHPLTPTDPIAAAKANKLAMLALANPFGSAGFATVAMDNPLAGDRAVLVSNMMAEGAEELFPILNSDVLTTRDNLRQGAVDLLQLTRVLKDCTEASCGGLWIDPERIYFVGTSMGATIGAMYAAHSPDVARVVLNAPGAALADTLVNSPVLTAELAPSLCAAGLIGAACCQEPTSCTPADLAVDPGMAQFKLSAQWMLDPADPINHARRLAAAVAAGEKRVLVQQPTGDMVFGSMGGARLAGLLGVAGPDTFKAYDPGELCSSVPGGAHSMLLSPCLETEQMVGDIITFLLTP